MWAKGVVVWGVARPGSETCKTNPISPGRGRAPEAKCAEQTQFVAEAHDCGLGIADCGL
jgi:hypothetical protein